MEDLSSKNRTMHSFERTVAIISKLPVSTFHRLLTVKITHISHLSQLATLNNSRQLNNTKTPEITRKSPIIRQETPKLGKTQNLQGIAYHYTFLTVFDLG